MRGNISEPFVSETQSSAGAVESEPSYRVDLKAIWSVSIEILKYIKHKNSMKNY